MNETKSVPQTLGSGCTALDDKAATTINTHGLEAWDTDQTRRSLGEYQSFTTDLGTEGKLTDFNLANGAVNGVMPFWAAARVGRQPLAEEGDSRYVQAQPDKANKCESDCLLPNAVAIPGSNHLLHSVSQGIDEGMTHYKSFYEDLRVVQQILTAPARKERLLATCFVGTPYAGESKCIEQFSFSLHEPRWSAVFAFSQASIRPIAVLRRAWCARAYSGNGEHVVVEKMVADGAQFDPRALTKILRSPLFRGYQHMVVKAKKPVNRLTSWFEGCPCHEKLLIVDAVETETRRRRGQSVRAALVQDGLPDGRCPLMSCRISEVVDGKVDEVLAEGLEASTQQLKTTLALRQQDASLGPMSDSEWAMVMHDWQCANSRLVLSVAIKFAWCKHLPWLLFGMAHPIVSRAIAIAKRCVALYDQLPDDKHHRKSVVFLKRGSRYRMLIEGFIESGTMHEELTFQVAIFALTPLSDRPVEREHLYLSEVAKGKGCQRLGHNFSTRRLLYICKTNENPDFDRRFTDVFMSLRTYNLVIDAFGWTQHPELSELYEKKNATKDDGRRAWSLLEKLFYRTEIAQKYERHREARRHHQLHDASDRQQVEGERPHKNRQAKALDDVLLGNVLSHLKTVCSSYDMITMPSMMGGRPTVTARTVDELLHPDEALDDAVADSEESDGNNSVRSSSPKRRRLLADAPVGDDEPLMALVERADDNGTIMAFRILKANLGNTKTISTYIHRTGQRLAQDDVAITLHDCIDHSAERLCTNIAPRISPGRSCHVFIVSDFNVGESFEHLKARCIGWRSERKPREIRYMLPVECDSSQVHDAVSSLFFANAVHGSDGTLDTDATVTPWRELLEAGHVTAQGNGIRLSESGLDDLTCAQINTVPRPLFAVRADVPIEDLSALELALTLQERGWIWEHFPRKIEDRKQLRHAIADGAGRWYGLGITLIRPYLLALLQSEMLYHKFGTESIPHYTRRPAQDYARILEGKAITDQDAQPERQQQLADEYAEGERLAVADGQVGDEEDDRDVADDGGDDVETLEDAMGKALEIYWAEEAEKQVADPEDEGNHDVFDDEVAPEVPPDDGQQLVVIDAVQRRASGSRRRLVVTQWGCGSYARLPSGSYECRCKHHKKTLATPSCKNTFGFEEGSEDLAINACRHWLNQAASHDLQSTHLACMTSVFDVPLFAEEILIRNRIDVAPTDVQTDDEVLAARGQASNFAAGVVAEQGVQGGAREGRGRGQAKRGRFDQIEKIHQTIME